MPRSSSSSSWEKCHFSALVTRQYPSPSHRLGWRLQKRAHYRLVMNLIHKVPHQRLQRTPIHHIPQLFESTWSLDDFHEESIIIIISFASFAPATSGPENSSIDSRGQLLHQHIKVLPTINLRHGSAWCSSHDAPLSHIRAGGNQGCRRWNRRSEDCVERKRQRAYRG